MPNHSIYNRPVYVSDLDTWSFCNYAFKIDFELENKGIKIETKEMEKGSKSHEHIEKELKKVGTPKIFKSFDDVIKHSLKGHFIYGQEKYLKSKTMPLVGRIDIYFCIGGDFYILDFKTSRAPNVPSKRFRSRVWDGQGTTLFCYGILLEENTNVIPKMGINYISDEEEQKITHKVERSEFEVNDFMTLYEKSEKIPYTEELKAYTIGQIEMIAGFIDGKVKASRSHNSPGRCKGCRRGELCQIKLV